MTFDTHKKAASETSLYATEQLLDLLQDTRGYLTNRAYAPGLTGSMFQSGARQDLNTFDLTAKPTYQGESPIGFHRVIHPDGRMSLHYTREDAMREIRNSRPAFQQLVHAVEFAITTGGTY